jgi:hypothetical protein
MIGSGFVALPFSGQANGGPEVVGDLSSVCAATSSQTFEIGMWDHSSNNLPAAASNTQFASPGEYSLGGGMTSTISGGVARISGLPSLKDSSKFLSLPITTSVDSRIVLSGLSLVTGETPVGLKVSAELYLLESAIQSQISSATFAEAAVVSSQTQRFEMSSTLLRTNRQYYVRVFLWDSAGLGTEVELDSISLDFKKCLAGAPTSITYTPSDTSIRVEFTAPANTGTSTITNYEYSLDSGSNWQTPSPAVTSSPLTIQGLTTATTYQVQTRAVTTAGGGGVASPTQSVMTTGEPASPASSATLVRSIGNFGLNQDMAPITMKAEGSGTYTYAQTGTLPAGVAFDTSTGILSGRPTQAGSFTFTVTMSEGGAQVDSVTYTGQVFTFIVMDNTALRFGNGNQHSISSEGLFEQPFYRSPISGEYFKLTYSSYPLDMAIGTGTRSGWPSSNVVDLESAPRVSQFLDYREYVSTSATSGNSKGYGKITVLTTFTINAQAIEVKHVYSLGQTDKFVKIDTTSTNKSGSQVTNMHVWVGTRDDYVGSSDQPTKLKGNLDGPNGSFNAITNAATEARALRITTGAEGALFYSTTPGTNMSIDGCCSFSNAYNVNPTSSPITLTGDGSYAAMLPIGNIQNNQSATITWFYAAGALADLDAVAQAVAAAAAPPPPVVTRSDTAATISWDVPEVEPGSTIIGYNYRYSTDNGATWIVSADLPTSPRTATISGLDNTEEFIFQVRAITQVGSDASTRANGAWSGSSEAEILGAPEAPNVTSVTGGNGQLTVAFEAPTSPVSPITHYQYCLNNCDDADNWESFLNDASPRAPTIPTSPVTITDGVTNGSNYNVRIRAVNIHGASNPSNATTTRTIPAWTTGTTLSAITKGATANITLVAQSDVTYAITSGALPTGLTFNTSTGRIAGSTLVGGPFTITVTATNSAGAAARTFTGVITPYWIPTLTQLTGNVGSALDEIINASEVTGLNLSSGATISVTGLPGGMTFSVARASTANVAPILTLGGAPLEPGTYTITVTITGTGGATVTSQIEIVVGEALASPPSSSGGGLLPTPTPTPTPSLTPRPTPRPTATPTPPNLGPTVRPSPSPSSSTALGPIVLLPELERIPNVVFSPSNPIPELLFDILSRPLAYVKSTNGQLALPTLAPTESMAYVNGEPVSVILTMNESESGFVLQGDGWLVNLEATNSNGTPLRIDESGNIILNSDRVVQFSGAGFAPGSKIKVWLFSDPTALTTVTAGADGTFTGFANLPSGIDVGQHTVQLNGLTEDGQIRSVSLGVVVEPVAVVPAPVPFDFSGLMNMLWILAAGVLLFFFILWRRRNKEEEEVLSPVTDISEDLILASDVFEVQPTQQFPNDSRRKIGPAAPPNRKRFGFNPKGA